MLRQILFGLAIGTITAVCIIMVCEICSDEHILIALLFADEHMVHRKLAERRIKIVNVDSPLFMYSRTVNHFYDNGTVASKIVFHNNHDRLKHAKTKAIVIVYDGIDIGKVFIDNKQINLTDHDKQYYSNNFLY